ncbi:MAG: acyl-CoA desaturase [Chlamydiae bacterium]|nr:acyl-CoA desaturase [Chlamydiota bacterium]
MKKSNFNWGPALFLIGYHIALLVMLPIYLFKTSPSGQLWLSAFVLLYLTGLSITVGYHRLYSHLTYKTRPVVEFLLLFFGAMATQGSALKWSFEHRIHHAFVDTDSDPYSIKKGFWYAHFLWLFEKQKPIEKRVVADLMKNRMLMFQDRYYGICMILTNAAACLFVGWLTNDYFGAFVIAGLFRLFLLHHFTWFINSLAHTWGKRTYCQELSAVDNYIIAFLTFGEGYHNYHHTFAYDYRNGIKWYHFDPSKWIIWSLSKMGLASKLKKNQKHFIDERILLDRKKVLLDSLQSTYFEQKEVVREKIEAFSERAQQKLKQLKDLSEKYQSSKKAREGRVVLAQLKAQIKKSKKEYNDELENLIASSKDIISASVKPKPTTAH